jgi:hypothetical protein
MPSWQERIKDSSEPALRAERDARYRFAAPVIAAAQVWCDVRLDGSAPEPPEGFEGEAIVTGPDELVSALEGKAGVVVTCFDVIERLEAFAPLVEALETLADATVLLSVPNEVGGSSPWGEGAFAELRSLLPDGHAVAEQTALNGSVIGAPDGGTPTHFIASWGTSPELGEVRETAAVDLREQRDWVRRQLADLAFYKAAYEEREGERDRPAPRELPPPS